MTSNIDSGNLDELRGTSCDCLDSKPNVVYVDIRHVAVIVSFDPIRGSPPQSKLIHQP